MTTVKVLTGRGQGRVSAGRTRGQNLGLEVGKMIGMFCATFPKEPCVSDFDL